MHCQNEISRNENYLCHTCWEQVNPTYYEDFSDITPLDQLFFGRIILKNTYSLYHYIEGNPIQSLIHSLKYKNNEKIGSYLGEIIGEKIKIMKCDLKFDVVFPVPIHPKKKYQRGFNQCDALSEAIAKSLNASFDKTLLEKIKNTSSQTRKSKWERWENSLDNFKIKKADIHFKHILIVDDVITTGSTMESLVKMLKNHFDNIEISIASIAFAG